MSALHKANNEGALLVDARERDEVQVLAFDDDFLRPGVAAATQPAGRGAVRKRCREAAWRCALAY